jgi:hypothetical protein
MNLKNPLSLFNPENTPERGETNDVMSNLVRRLNLAVWHIDMTNYASGIKPEEKALDSMAEAETVNENIATELRTDRKALEIASNLSVQKAASTPSPAEQALQNVLTIHDSQNVAAHEFKLAE